MADNEPPLRARPWKRPPGSGKASTPFGSYRFVVRLLALPALVVCGVLLYNGVRNHVVLPECDSEEARKSLAPVLEQLNFKPTQYAPIKTISSSKDQVVCNAVLPLPDGGNVVADFTFYWQGDAVQMRYSVGRQSAGGAPVTPAAPVTPPLR